MLFIIFLLFSPSWGSHKWKSAQWSHSVSMTFQKKEKKYWETDYVGQKKDVTPLAVTLYIYTL